LHRQSEIAREFARDVLFWLHSIPTVLLNGQKRSMGQFEQDPLTPTNLALQKHAVIDIELVPRVALLAPHNVKLEAPARQYDPVGHAVQFAAPAREYVPDEHADVIAESPVVAQ
jgi:hypothetical protein